jgi:hypothetical protein
VAGPVECCALAALAAALSGVVIVFSLQADVFVIPRGARSEPEGNMRFEAVVFNSARIGANKGNIIPDFEVQNGWKRFKEAVHKSAIKLSSQCRVDGF